VLRRQLDDGRARRVERRILDHHRLELAAQHSLPRDFQAMRREADVFDEPAILSDLQPFESATFRHHLCPCLGLRDIVQLVEAHPGEPEHRERAVDFVLSAAGAAAERLRGDVQSVRTPLAHNPAEKVLAALVVARGIDEVDAQIDGGADGFSGFWRMRRVHGSKSQLGDEQSAAAEAPFVEGAHRTSVHLAEADRNEDVAPC